MSSIAEAIALAAPSFTGQLLQPTDPAYDDRRRVHNGLIDKHPAAIACCHGVADVVDAVRLARTLGLEVSVRGGGHNVAGRATIDQGLMIDLSPMKGIHVDVPRAHGARSGRRPVERAQPRNAAAWTRDDRRRRRQHRDRRPDARRRTWLADAEVRPCARQPAGRRDGDGRRHACFARAPTRIRICSGRFAAAAATSASPRRSSTRCTAVGPMITGGVVVHPLAASARRAALLPGHLRVAA